MQPRPIVLLAALALALPAAAEDPRGGRPGAPEVDVIVPLDPREHDRLHWFDGEPHHLAPGTVSIDAPPYVCDRDGRTFTDRDAFTAHLRRAHGRDPSTPRRRGWSGSLPPVTPD